jgi:AbrB family looped-hinge helix DNA binding protein
MLSLTLQENIHSYHGKILVMIKATVSSKGQIAIPKSVRERMDLKPGTQVEIDIKGESVVMRKLVSGFPEWRTMQGMAASGPSLTQTLEEEHRAEMERDDARL